MYGGVAGSKMSLAAFNENTKARFAGHTSRWDFSSRSSFLSILLASMHSTTCQLCMQCLYRSSDGPVSLKHQNRASKREASIAQLYRINSSVIVLYFMLYHLAAQTNLSCK